MLHRKLDECEPIVRVPATLGSELDLWKGGKLKESRLSKVADMVLESVLCPQSDRHCTQPETAAGWL
jgi:hypothetical protein